MMHLQPNHVEHEPLLRLRLQFFAEGAAEGGGAEGNAGGEATPPAGSEAGNGSTTKPEGKVYTQEDATAVAKQFKMIPHNGVKERYKSTFDKAEKYDSMATHFGAIAEKYGVSLDNPEGLARAILADPDRIKAKAAELGTSVEVAKSLVEADATNAITRAKEAARIRQEEFTRMSQEEAAVKEVYPNFDFDKASGNRAFKALVDSGIPMKDAYEMSNHAELTAAALAAAREQGKADAEAAIKEAAERPIEGAARHTATSSTDVSKLHGKELDAFLESYLTK